MAQGGRSDGQGASLDAQGTSLDIQGGGLLGSWRASLAGHADPPASGDGWRAAQPGSPGTRGEGGPSQARAGARVRAASEEAALA